MIYTVYQSLLFLTLSLITFLGYLKLLAITPGTFLVEVLITFFIIYFYYALINDKDQPKLHRLHHIYEWALIILSCLWVVYTCYLMINELSITT